MSQPEVDPSFEALPNPLKRVVISLITRVAIIGTFASIGSGCLDSKAVNPDTPNNGPSNEELSTYHGG